MGTFGSPGLIPGRFLIPAFAERERGGGGVLISDQQQRGGGGGEGTPSESNPTGSIPIGSIPVSSRFHKLECVSQLP